MLAVPVVVAANVAEQVAVPAVVPAASVHGLPENDPVTPVWLKLTVPVGVRPVPAVEVSATVATQVVDTLTEIVEGVQVTLVLVVRRLTVTLAAVLWLPVCPASPAYDPVMLAVPAVEGRKVDEQVAVPATAPAASVQVVNVPVTPPTVKVTEPVGVVAPVAELSVTVAPQDEPWLITTGLAQVTLVVVAWTGEVTVTATVLLVLPLCAVSPANEALMLADPADDGVNVDEHVAVPATVPAASVQVENEPVTVETENVTDPVGVRAVPEVDVSVTVAVHVDV